MATIAELRQQAATIKNATQVGENTANRVGTTFETVADLLDEEGGGGTGNLAFVDINDIDGIKEISDMLSENPNVYTVTKIAGTQTIKVGTLFVFTNQAYWEVSQVLISNYVLDSEGHIGNTSNDKVQMYYRLCKTRNGGTLPEPVGTWTAWTEMGAGGGGDINIDPYPTNGSDNAVASGGVFNAIAAASTRKVNVSDIDNIGNYTDMLADAPSFYTVVATSSNNTFRTGTLMVFTNTNKYVLLQVLVSGYILNNDGTLDTGGSDFAAKILWRGKWFNGTPPAGTNIGEWSPWSSLGGGGGVDAYTKNETDALLARKQNVLTFDNTPTPNSNNPVKSSGIYTALDGKFEKAGGTITGNVTFNGSIILHDLAQIQEGNVEMTDVLDERYELKLTWDNTPTDSSNNPVKSGGVYDFVVNALSAYIPATQFATINGSVITQGGNIQVLVPQGAITIDATPSPNSQNAVSSGGVYDAIEGGFYY